MVKLPVLKLDISLSKYIRIAWDGLKPICFVFGEVRVIAGLKVSRSALIKNEQVKLSPLAWAAAKSPAVQVTPAPQILTLSSWAHCLLLLVPPWHKPNRSFSL